MQLVKLHDMGIPVDPQRKIENKYVKKRVKLVSPLWLKPNFTLFNFCSIRLKV